MLFKGIVLLELFKSLLDVKIAAFKIESRLCFKIPYLILLGLFEHL
jgi:hypothetical protein